MNEDFVCNVAYISKELNSLVDEARPYILGMYLDPSKPLEIEEVMEVRRILNEYNALALLLSLAKPTQATQNDKKSSLKKLFKK